MAQPQGQKPNEDMLAVLKSIRAIIVVVAVGLAFALFLFGSALDSAGTANF